jgi:hypothetical protein
MSIFAAEPEDGLFSKAERGAALAILALGGVLLAWVGKLAHCENAHLVLSLALTPDRVRSALGQGCDIGDIRTAILVDFVAIALYSTGLHLVLTRFWRYGWRSPSQSTKSVRTIVGLLPLVVGALDAVENVAVLGALQSGDLAHVHSVPLAIAGVAGVGKWMLASVVVLMTFLTLYGAFRFRSIELQATEDSAGRDQNAEPPKGFAVCLSGGGIRSAAFAWGALAKLEDSGHFATADHLYSVSGGGYTAAAWSGRKGPDPQNPRHFFALDGADSDVTKFVRSHRMYLGTDPGGVVRTGVRAVASILLNIAVILGGVTVLAIPLALFGRSRLALVTRDSHTVVARAWLPSLSYLAVAVILLAVSTRLSGPVRQAVVRTALAIAAFAGLIAVVLIVVPWSALHLNVAQTRFKFAPLVSWILSMVVAAVRQRFGKKVSRLGGVLSAVAMVFVALLLVQKAINSSYTSSTFFLLFGLVVAALVCVDFSGAQWWSFHALYRRRLARSFTIHRGGRDVRAQTPDEWVRPLEWRDREAIATPGNGPKHVVCAATHRRDNKVTGLHSISFTFASDGVRMHVPEFDPVGKVDVRTYSAGPEWLEKSIATNTGRGARKLSIIGAAAVSGAAFNSAMGRHSKGTTDSLLAVLNLRLGVWLPNPRYTTLHGGAFPTAGLRYLFHEVIGRFDVLDPFVHVSDGGHWENLGLVEALRARHETVVCVDASGGMVEPLSTGPSARGFEAVYEAIDLARSELHYEIRINFDELRPDLRTGRCHQNWAVGEIVYHRNPDHDWRPASPNGRGCDSGCPTGKLVYVKALVSDRTPESVIAFANEDRVFPDYPTADQFLTDGQFDALTRLGESAMDGALTGAGL